MSDIQMKRRSSAGFLIFGLGGLCGIGCTNGGAPMVPDMRAPDLQTQAQNVLPSFVHGPITSHTYDGTTDDLLTAGVGQTGIPKAAPVPQNPTSPSAADLRRQAIVTQYQALIDTRAEAGFGTLAGPAVPTEFATPTGDGRVPGKEYLAYDDDGSGNKNVTMMVQVPTSFDKDHPCLVVTVSSGSRGVYGAIGTAGEWGLKNGCAVVHTDKGTGSGVHDLNTDTVNRIDGTRGTAASVGTAANFRAAGGATQTLAAYNSQFPDRIAQKHAHSQQNPEAAWGQDVLHAAEFAFYVLNRPENFGTPIGSGATAGSLVNITKDKTLVIAASVSNGGGAVLRALEQDTTGLIDGVVASEPNVNPQRLSGAQAFKIQQGATTYDGTVHGKPLFDYITYSNVYQSCASAGTMLALGQDPAKGPPATGGFLAGMPGRCAALKQAGLLKSTTLSDQIAEAQGLINAYGTLPGTNVIAHPYAAYYVYSSIAVTYANAYGGFGVTDNLCGYSFGATVMAGPPMPKNPTDLSADFALSNGVPPSNNTWLVNNSGNNGAGIEIRQGKDPNGNLDEYLAGALCLRSLATGTTGVTADTGNPLTGTALANYQRVQAGMQKVLATGNLHGKPALIVHGRDDALLGLNFTSRSYYGLNQTVEGTKSQLAYVEVLHANHLDALNRDFNIDTQIPLDLYFQSALDSMYAHLKNGTPLPNSQVLPTMPIGTTGDLTLTRKNLPAFGSAMSCPITWSGNILDIPDCTQ